MSRQSREYTGCAVRINKPSGAALSEQPYTSLKLHHDMSFHRDYLSVLIRDHVMHPDTSVKSIYWPTVENDYKQYK